MKRNVTKLEMPEATGLFICISYGFRKTDIDKEHAIPAITYMVENKDKTRIVEWEPSFGPITVIDKCAEDCVTSKDEYITVEPHWYLGHCKGFDSWSQCAVTDYDLPRALVEGSFTYIKSVLDKFL